MVSATTATVTLCGPMSEVQRLCPVGAKVTLRGDFDPQAASPVMESVRDRPRLDHVAGTDHDLLIRLLRSRHGWAPGQSRAAHVANMTGHGSSVAYALCRFAEIDPKEVLAATEVDDG